MPIVIPLFLYAYRVFKKSFVGKTTCYSDYSLFFRVNYYPKRLSRTYNTVKLLILHHKSCVYASNAIRGRKFKRATLLHYYIYIVHVTRYIYKVGAKPSQSLLTETRCSSDHVTDVELVHRRPEDPTRAFPSPSPPPHTVDPTKALANAPARVYHPSDETTRWRGGGGPQHGSLSVRSFKTVYACGATNQIAVRLVAGNK